MFKEYAVLTVLLLTSILLLVSNDNSQLRHVRALAVGTVGFFQSAISSVPNVFTLESENRHLGEVNVNLADEVNQLREARLENLRLRSMIALKETSTVHLIAGKVVGKNLNLLRNTLTLNVGENDGVHPGMPVVTGEGLAGRVVSTSGGYAIVQSVLNLDFRSSAKDQRSRVDGIVAWDGHELTLSNVAKTLDVQPGDAIVTSEYSNAFPSGLKLGVIASVEAIPGSLFKRVLVTPSVDFVRLEEAFVCDYVPSIEKMILEEKAQK